MTKRLDLQKLVELLVTHRARWLVPAAVIAAATAFYVCIYPPVWEAAQSILVRDEAVGAVGTVGRPGRFNDQVSMKSAQETLVDLAHSEAVITAALKQADPRHRSPFSGKVQTIQDSVRILPPNGAEFGSTEVLSLRVRERGKENALRLISAIFEQLGRHLRSVRDQRAQSLVAELGSAARLAREELEQVTGRLAALEREVGQDLGELRNLSEQLTGESNLRQASTPIRNELRQQQQNRNTNQQMLDMLSAVEADTRQLLAMPNELLASQPALKQLREGLVAVQLLAANLRGQYTEDHPRVQNSLVAEAEIHRKIRRELGATIQNLRADIELTDGRIRTLEGQLAQNTERTERLVSVRAEYSNLVAEVKNRSDALKNAEHDLSEARAGQEAARSSSLIAAVGEPTTGRSPVGPRRLLVLLAGLIGGPVFGVGLLFLTLPAEQMPFVRSVSPANASVRPREGREPASQPPLAWRTQFPSRSEAAGTRDEKWPEEKRSEPISVLSFKDALFQLFPKPNAGRPSRN